MRQQFAMGLAAILLAQTWCWGTPLAGDPKYGDGRLVGIYPGQYGCDDPRSSGIPLKASTGDPLALVDDLPLETAIDIELSTLAPGLPFSVVRTYDFGSGSGVHVASRWLNSIDRFQMIVNGSDYEVHSDGRNLWSFTAPGYDSGAAGYMDLEVTATEFILTDRLTNDVWIFQAPTGAGVVAPLKERTTRSWRAAGKTGLTYTYSSIGSPISQELLTSVTFPTGDGRSATLEYGGAGGLVLEKVRVWEGSPGTSTEIQQVEYVYPADYRAMLAIRRTRTTNGVWEEEYHFHDRDTAIFLEHEAVVQTMDAQSWSTPNPIVNNPTSAAPYATRTFGYDNTNTNDEPNLPNATSSNMATHYGITAAGYRLVETVRSPPRQLIRRTYRFTNSTGPIETVWVTDVYDASFDIAETNATVIQDALMHRVVRGLNADGVTLLHAIIDRPTHSDPTFWCTTYKYDNDRLSEIRHPSCYARGPGSSSTVEVDTNADLKTLIDAPYDTWQPNGRMFTFEYTSDHFLSGVRAKHGPSATDAHYVWAADYGAGLPSGNPSYMIEATYDFPTKVTQKTGGNSTSIQYTYWDTTTKIQVKKIVKTFPQVATTKNASGISTSEESYFDQVGRLRWTKDGEGYVNYLSYDATTGQLAVNAVDVDPTSDPVASGTWLAWTADNANDSSAKPTRGSGLPTALSLASRAEYDAVGRVTYEIDPDDTKHRRAYFEHHEAYYPYWDAGTSKPKLPYRIVKYDEADMVEEVFEAAASTANASGTTGTSASQSDYTRWVQYAYDSIGRLDYRDDFYDIPTSGVGLVSTVKSRTALKYDPEGRVNQLHQSVRPSGAPGSAPIWQVTTFDRDVFDRITNVYRGVGTVSGTTIPTTKKVEEYQYDRGGAGDGNLTARMRYYDDNTKNYGFLFRYDYRGRLRGVQSVYDFDPASMIVEGTASASKTRWTYTFDVDWNGRQTAAARSGGVPAWTGMLNYDDYVAGNVKTGTSTARWDYSRTYFDELGRAYRSEAYDTSVDGSTNRFLTDYYYDRRDLLVAVQPKFEAATEFAFDGSGRLYQRRRANELVTGTNKYVSGAYHYLEPAPNPEVSSTGTASFTGGDEGIAHFMHLVFDGDTSNVIEEHLYQMAGGYDGLNLSGSDYIRTSVYSWYDDTDRPTAIASYGSGDTTGTAGSWKYVASTPTRPTSPPNVNDDTSVLRRFTYDSTNAEIDGILDDLGRTVSHDFDRLGRLTSVTDTITQARSFDDLGNLTQISHWNGVTPITNPYNNQVTKYKYEDAYNATLPTQVVDVRFGYNSSGTPTSVLSDANSATTDLTYALDGEVKTRSRSNPTRTITYLYDAVGEGRRLYWEQATGTGSVGDIKSIRSYYDDKGRRYLTRSYADATGGAIRNDVFHEYSNRFDQLVKSYQSHEGQYSTSTTPYVWYDYDPSLQSGIYDDALRLGLLIYPSDATSGRHARASYTFDEVTNDRFHRPQRIRTNMESSVGTYKWQTQYYYSGAHRLIKQRYEVPSTDKLELIRGSGTDFFNLDRFGRVKSQVWKVWSGTEKDRYDYSHDKVGNRLDRTVGTSLGSHPTIDQQYTYDSDHRLDTWKDGSNTLKQDWTLDLPGNWSSLSVGSETRTHFVDSNQIKSISGWTNPYVSVPGSYLDDAPSYSYDNLTIAPDPLGNATAVKYVYDPWDRLIEYENTDGDAVEFEYDGLHRRISKTSTPSGGSADTEHYYYNNNWQILEVRKNTSTTPSELYLWHPQYVDALAVRFHDINADGTFTGDEVQYVMQDANYNVTAIANASGTVLERYAYDPYGKRTILDPDFSSDSDGNTYAVPYGFTGRRLDDETGLYQFRFRHYDPNLGRFLEQDPISYAAGANVYEYGLGRPTMVVDPAGLSGIMMLSALPWSKVSVHQDLADERIRTAAALNAHAQSAQGLVTGFLQVLTLGRVQHRDDIELLAVPDSRFYRMSLSGHRKVADWGQGALTGGLGRTSLGRVIDAADTVSDYRDIAEGVHERDPERFIGGLLGRIGSGATKRYSRSCDNRGGTRNVGPDDVAVAPTNAPRQFWTKSKAFNGNKVFQRDDLIDPKLIDSRGRTNLERMQKGLAPIGPDGESINLHHLIQTQDGAIAEVTQTFHQQNYGTLHINPNTVPSGIDRNAFKAWKRRYWIDRANDFGGSP